MLGEHTIDVMLLSTDLEVTKEPHGGKIGLDVLLEQENVFVTFKCAGDSRLVVTKSTIGTADEQTQACWRVDDLPSEVADLRSRGVEILDMPDLGTVDGNRRCRLRVHGRLRGSHRNSIALIQLKQDPGDIT